MKNQYCYLIQSCVDNDDDIPHFCKIGIVSTENEAKMMVELLQNDFDLYLEEIKQLIKPLLDEIKIINDLPISMLERFERNVQLNKKNSENNLPIRVPEKIIFSYEKIDVLNMENIKIMGQNHYRDLYQ